MSSSQLSGRPHQVLVVEDAPDADRMIASALQHSGAEVLFECNVESAVEQFERRQGHCPFGTIVIHLQSPMVDGIRLTRQLRAKGFNGRIIAIMDHGTSTVEKTWQAAGCDILLDAPIESPQIACLMLPSAGC